nr:hypothetical protein [Tanacetum cinerariifolium]
MAKLVFCDYHNMIAILEKSEYNINFHQIVDFVEVSHIRYALTINLTVYVSHIHQFWSTAKIETSNEVTKILATVDGKPRTISESSIRRNLKVNDETGISSLPDANLFENLTLMGSNIDTAVVCLATSRVYNFSKMIFDGMGEGSGTPTEPQHTPSPEAQQSPQHDLSLSIHPPVTTETIPTLTPTEILTLRQYSRRAKRIAQSTALLTVANEPASLLRDDSQGEAFPTVFGLKAGQDRENIIKTSALPHDSTQRQIEMASKITAQDLEISNLKARIKLLEDKDGGGAEPSGEDATIKGRSLETGEEAGVEKSTKRGSNDTEELVNVLTSMDAANILTSGVQAVSIPPVTKVSNIGVPTGSGLVPTVSAIFTTASVVTPYSRRKGKEKMVKSDTPKKKKLQEQIDVHVAREMEEKMAREDQRRNEQIARDAEIARIHVEEELQMLIDSLDRNNEIIAKYLQEYEQFAVDLSIGEKVDMINELVKYQDHYAKKIKDFVPMASKEEGERVKRKGLKLEQESAKKMKTSEEMKHQVWGRIDGNKMLKSFPLPVMKFPLPEYFPTASEEIFPLLRQRDAPTEEVCTADEVKD